MFLGGELENGGCVLGLRDEKGLGLEALRLGCVKGG